MAQMFARVEGAFGVNNYGIANTEELAGTILFADGCRAASSIFSRVNFATKNTHHHVTVSPWGSCCFDHRSTHEREYVEVSAVVATLDLMGIVCLNY